VFSVDSVFDFSVTSSPSVRLLLLRDRIRPGVRVLFVGINPGIRSALTGHHFAGYSNRFWKLLYEARVVPAQMTAEDDEKFPGWGYGITNLVRRPTPGIGDLSRAEYEDGRRRLLAKLRRYRPAVVVLVGVTLHRMLFPGARLLKLGLQPETLCGARVFLLPNPSGRNANYSYAEMLTAFRALARYLKKVGVRP
jgi:double-stranded uracil-DNA glycosylase